MNPALAPFKLLGDRPYEGDQNTLDLWLEIEMDGRAWLHYWRNEPDKTAKVLAAVRPVVEARTVPAHAQAFFWHLVALQKSRDTRYRIDEEMIANQRTAVAVAKQHLREPDIAFTVFALGFYLLWHGDLAEAEEHLRAALALVERTGEPVLRARCLCYLNVTFLRGHDVEAVRSTAPAAMAAAEVASYPEYVAAAKATQAWVAWQEGRTDDVVALANEALDLWATTVVSYSGYWLGLWPLVAVHLAKRRIAEAVQASRHLLAPPQQRLPDELESAVQLAIEAWDMSNPRLSEERLTAAVELARQLRYA